MATTKSTSRLAIVVVAAALVMVASPAAAQEWERWHPRYHGAVVLPSLPLLPPLPLLPRLPLLPPLPRLVPNLLRALVAPLWVAPRTWSDYEFYGSRRYTRGEDRRFVGTEGGRRNARHGERRGYREHRRYGEYGDRRR